jgi:hypothetical protein
MEAAKLIRHAMGAICFLVSTTIIAAPLFTIIPDRYSVLLGYGGMTQLTTTVTNSSGHALSNVSFTIGTSRITNGSASVISGGTCIDGASMASLESCTYIIQISAGDRPSLESLYPRYCANGGTICSQPRKPISINTAPIGNTVSITGSATTALPASTEIGVAYPLVVTFTNNDSSHPADDVYASNTYPTGFVQSINTCGTTTGRIHLAAGSSCTVEGLFTPATAGAATAVVVLHSANSSDIEVSNSTTAAVAQAVYIPSSTSNRVTKCDRNPTTGDLTDCGDAGVSSTLSGSYDVTLNTSGTLAYIPYSALESVQKCSVAANGTLSNCTDSGATDLAKPHSITFNTAGTIAYITNRNGGFGTPSVVRCDVSGTTGALSNCNDAEASPSGLMDGAIDVAFNESETQVFITNRTGGTGSNGAILRCTINDNGYFSNCSKIQTTLYCPFQLSFNTTHTKAYIGQGCSATAVHVCSVDMAGDLSNCTEQGTGFSSPVGVAINSDDTYAYVASTGSDAVYKCPLSNGDLGTCTQTATTSTTVAPFMLNVRQ